MSFKEWKYIEASSFCSKVADGTHDSPKRQDIGKPLITSKHIKGRSIDFDTAYLISQADFEKINLRSKVDQWDVLISMIGEYCGYCYVERNENIDYAVKNVGIFKTRSKLKAEWIYYYLNSPEGKNKLASLKSGTSQPYISLGALRGLPILIPPSENEMEKITSILSSLDEKIELNRQTNQTLEAIAQNLFKEMCLPKGDELSEGWRVGKLGDVVEIKYGKDHKHLESGQIPVYGSGGIMRYADKALYESESILIPRKGTLSNLFYINKPFWSVDTMFYTKINENASGKFLFLLLKTMNLASMNVGSAVPSLTTEVLNKLEIIIPSKDVLQTFNKLVSPFFETQEFNEQESQILITLRDSLLPKLMKGEIDVNISNG